MNKVLSIIKKTKKMKTKNILIVVALSLLTIFTACHDDVISSVNPELNSVNPELKSVSVQDASNSGTVATVTLLAGQTTNVGSLILNEIDTNADGINDAVSATYTLTGGWQLNEIHFWIGSSLLAMPQTKTGNPQVGQFPYSPADASGKSSYTITIPFSSINYTSCQASYVIAAHASVHLGTRTETAWAAGTQMNVKGSWATYFNFTLIDNNPPVITGTLAEINIEGCSAESAPVSVKNVSALEALGLSIADTRTTDINLVVSSNDVSKGSCPVEVTRTYKITDACGNSTTISQKINIEDTTPPEINGTIPASSIEGCVSSVPVAVNTLAGLQALGVTVVDACNNSDALSVTSNDVLSGTCPLVVSRTYTVADACGNKSVVKQVIKINDVTAPVLYGQGIASTITAPALPVFTDPGVTDDCDQNPTVTYNDVTVTNSGSSTITRTWTASDACGNTSAVSQSVTIINAPIVLPPVNECTSWRTETGFGGNSSGNGNAWWYYYNGSGTQTIWAGQNQNAGNVKLVNGYLIITLTDGWELQNVSESVKIQGYNSLPSSRPVAGQFTTYKGTALTVQVGSFPYYVVHLDVQKCNSYN
jgi:hypothetical protein